MRFGLVVNPCSEDNLHLANQIGVDEIVFSDINDKDHEAKRRFPEFDELRALRRRVESFGMNLSILETAFPMDQIIVSKPGRDRQIEQFKQALGAMGRAGIETLCYDWMPTELSVIRTSFEKRIRGGALTSAFDLPTYQKHVQATGVEISDDQMWDDLEYFLRRCVPAAEAAEVKLAIHPDDPPLSPLGGFARILRSPDAFDRLFSISSSECNGMTFCQGCFAEMGVDVPSAIRRFRERILFAHFRDVDFAEDGVSFHETFQDDGRTDMVEAMKAYGDIGFDGVIRPDHVPKLATEPGTANGYTMLGRLYAVGYMRGIAETLNSM
ncbi:MAG: mannonate dehydratase [Candidatus Latescibacterota bacterium]|nr:mannonate dehydratase [Candidatus Latescibacterota bacterium]